MPDKKSDKKRELILVKAREVFARKGFAAATMKDIIEECGISRGGIYLYFKSVDEIFMQVIVTLNQQKLKEDRDGITEEKSFRLMLDEYFDKQKNRLLNMRKSLLMAMHEYRFAHKDDDDKEFFQGQFSYIKAVILELLNCGVDRGEISQGNIEELAINIMFFIEGISTLATTMGVSEEIIDTQIDFMKRMILGGRES